MTFYGLFESIEQHTSVLSKFLYYVSTCKFNSPSSSHPVRIIDQEKREKNTEEL